MIKATNDGVSVTADYDEAGNSTGTKLQKSDGTGLYLQTHATYTAEKDHTASVTDANGGTTTFAYDSLGRNTSTSTPIDTGVTSTTEYSYVSGNDRQYGLPIRRAACYTMGIPMASKLRPAVIPRTAKRGPGSGTT